MGSPKQRMDLPVAGRDDVVLVAWHMGGAQTLRTSRRHVATVDAVEGRAPRETLCRRPWLRSREVIPNDYWTDGDCSRCFKAAGIEKGAT